MELAGSGWCLSLFHPSPFTPELLRPRFAILGRDTWGFAFAFVRAQVWKGKLTAHDWVFWTW